MACEELFRIAYDGSKPDWLRKEACLKLLEHCCANALYNLASDGSKPDWLREMAVECLGVLAGLPEDVEAFEVTVYKEHIVIRGGSLSFSELKKRAVKKLADLAYDGSKPDWLRKKAIRKI